MGLDSPGINI